MLRSTADKQEARKVDAFSGFGATRATAYYSTKAEKLKRKLMIWLSQPMASDSHFSSAHAFRRAFLPRTKITPDLDSLWVRVA